MSVQIVTPEAGYHNSDLANSRNRLLRGQSYKDLSTICVIPTRGQVHMRVLMSWWSMMTPMNQKFIRLPVVGTEVGEAYNNSVIHILQDSYLSGYKYLLTLEEDNMPPPDGLLKLFESINGKIDGNKYDAVGGLYWTKGPGGQPMIYGDPMDPPLNFRPQVPIIDSVQRCCGLGMGFTLFRLDMFRDERIVQPWFKTEQSYTPGVGARSYTQDLRFFELAGGWGYKFACDTRVKVGHYDAESDLVW